MSSDGEAAPVIELSVECDADRAEQVSDILEDCGALSCALVDAADAPLYEPPPGATPLWPRTRVSAQFTSAVAAEAARACLDPEVAAAATMTELPSRDWLAECAREAVTRRFGARLVVAPAAAEVDAAEVVVRLDPGLAFGTGGHPSTALCLEWLAGLPLAGLTVLDWGCGSGILAIAALALGADSALAVDIDPQALTATRRNAAANGVLGSLSVAHPGFVPPLRGDVMLANILAGPLCELAPVLLARLCPGASIALAGILEDQADRVCQAYAPGARLDIAARREGWVLLAGRSIG